MTIWKLRNNNPLRKSYVTNNIKHNEFDALIRITVEMSKYLYPYIREILKSKEMLIYLFDVLGLDESTIELGIKLSIKNKTPLTILLWSYGMLTIEELDKLYSFLFQKIE